MSDHATYEDIQDYFQALGELVSKFAAVESALQVTAALIAEVDVRVAQVLFGSMTVNICVETIREMRKAKGELPNEMLDKALEQLKSIAVVRNRTVHRGANIYSGGVAATREGFAAPGKAASRDVSMTTLRAMIRDLSTIEAALACIMLTAGGPAVPEELKAIWQQAGLAPWRYKQQ